MLMLSYFTLQAPTRGRKYIYNFSSPRRVCYETGSVCVTGVIIMELTSPSLMLMFAGSLVLPVDSEQALLVVVGKSLELLV